MNYATYLLGRHAECEIGVNDRTVSRRHAEIVVSGNTLMIIDRLSSEGTWVNEGDGWKRITQFVAREPVRVRFGDFETSSVELAEAVRSLGSRPPQGPAREPIVNLKGHAVRRNPQTGELEAR